MGRTEGYDEIKLQNDSGAIINPATEEKQDTIITELQTAKLNDTGNSTSTPLVGDATFTGEWVATAGYTQAIISVVTDKDSATGGLQLQISYDEGSTIAHYHQFTPLINNPEGHHYPSSLEGTHFRVVYTNGSVAQGIFRLNCTLLKSAVEEGHVHGLDYVLEDDHGAQIVRNVNTAKKPDGSYVNIGATTGGNLKVSIEEYDDAANPVRKNLEGVGDITIGVTQVEIAITGTPTHSIRIRADNDNTGIIFIGKTGVLSDGSNDFDRLESGDETIIDYDDVDNALYAISDTAAQTINVGALL